MRFFQLDPDAPVAADRAMAVPKQPESGAKKRDGDPAEKIGDRVAEGPPVPSNDSFRKKNQPRDVNGPHGRGEVRGNVSRPVRCGARSRWLSAGEREIVARSAQEQQKNSAGGLSEKQMFHVYRNSRTFQVREIGIATGSELGQVQVTVNVIIPLSSSSRDCSSGTGHLMFSYMPDTVI